MKYSVALCTYNGSRFIEKQLESIVRQTMKPHEIVVCDDASTDQTLELIAQFQRSCPEISFRIIRNSRNIGVIKNFENCLDLCSGDFIFLCDQDDVWDLSRIEVINSIINQKSFCSKDVVLLFNDLNIVDVALNTLQEKFLAKRASLFCADEKSSSFQLIQKNWVPGCSMVISQGLKSLSLPFPEKVHMHDHWLLLLSSFYGNTHYIDTALVQYRQHGSNTVGVDHFFRSFLKHVFVSKYYKQKLTRLKVKLCQAESLLSRGMMLGQSLKWPGLSTYLELLRSFSPVKLMLFVLKERISGLGLAPWLIQLIGSIKKQENSPQESL